MAHVNLGPYQVIYWPRWCVWFGYRNVAVYAWVFYLWPLEFRRFRSVTNPPVTGGARSAA